MLALALLTYGHLDAVEDILNNIPSSPKARIRSSVKALKVFLPLPDDLDPLSNSEGVRTWFSQHRELLQWDVGKGIFVLVDD